MSTKLMKFMLFFIWMATILCCSLAQKAIDNLRYKACAPKSCGTGPNISYPFYIEGAGTHYCGRQGFRITCQNNKPIFRTDGGPYIINHIFYKNNSLKIADLDVVDADCVAPRHYFQFSRDQNFNFSSNHGNVQFFYQCTTNSFLPNLEKSLVPCASNSTHSTLVAVVPNDHNLGTTINVSKQYCKKQIAVPVDLSGNNNNNNNQSIKRVNYTKLLKEGFSLVWYGLDSHPCEACESNGGRCGFQNNGFVCFYPNETHDVNIEEKTAKQGPPKEEEKKKDEGEAKTEVKIVDQEASKVETEKEKEKVVVVVTEVASVDDDGAKTVEAIEESVVSVTPAPVDEASSSAKTETEEPKKEEEKEEQEVCVPPEEVSIWGIPLLADDRSDVTLLKFLKARDYKVKEAFTMLKNTVKWRKENGIDYLIEEDLGSDWDKRWFASDSQWKPDCV